MKKYLTFIVIITFYILFFSENGQAQVPTITSFSPASGPVGTTVTITGTNFSTTTSNNIVYFGATKATVNAATANELTVTVPTGATYNPISVETNNLSAFSNIGFATTFSCGGAINSSTFDTKVDYSVGSGPSGLALADLDGDGKAEIIQANGSAIAGALGIFRNTSSVGAISFAARVIFPGVFYGGDVSIADLDGDGKLDIVLLAPNGNAVSIYRNTSISGVISLAARVDYPTGSQAISVSISDFDDDGKPDIVVVNQYDYTVSVFKNASTSGTISFAAKIDFSTGNMPIGVITGDFDGDWKMDIAVANYASNTISLLRNTSTGGAISFAAKVDLFAGSNPHFISTGDLNGDGKLDLAVVDYSWNYVNVFTNYSSIGNFSFSQQYYGTNSSPLKTTISDIDGDGKPEIAVAYNNTSSSVSILKNAGTSFNSKVDFITGSYPGGITIGDLDNDGKTDMVVANSGSSSLSVFRNITNNIPSMTSANAANICTGMAVNIPLTSNPHSTYTWIANDNPNTTGESTTLQTTSTIFNTIVNNSSSVQTITYTVTPGCGGTPQIVTVTVNPLPTVGSTASLTNVCTGASVTLSGTGATSYVWSGGVTNGISFVPASSTTYTVTGTDANSCTNTATRIITVNPLPTVTASATVSTLCAGSSTILTGGGAISYAWSGGITNGTSFAPASTTAYTVTGTDGNSCTNTATKTITVNPLPGDAGTISGSISVSQGQNSVLYSVPAIVNATSYTWTLPSDATGTSTTSSITVNYGAAAVSGNITVKGNNSCGDGASSNLGITVNPVINLALYQTELWGMTSSGGNGGGVIFKTDANGDNQQLMHTFIENPGQRPYLAQLCQASNGKMYGMTQLGGANNIGVLFEYDPNTGIETKKLDFAGTTNGSNPNGSLMQASNGKLYGMTQLGGSINGGVLFEYDPSSGIYAKKVDFIVTNGVGPQGSLVQASNGKLYGMTPQGGANGMGVLFEYDPVAGIFTNKINFTGTTNGSYPSGSLMKTINGKLYGMTYQGGANNMGVIFEYNPSNATLTKKLSFAGTTNGSYPKGSLIQALNGKLYGMTSQGGTNGLGIIFEYDTLTSTNTKKLDFAGATNGSTPSGSMMEASNGKLYGMTPGGGANALGVLFVYDPLTDSYNKKLDFSYSNTGYSPFGTLMQASNGKMYGLTYWGGANNCGVLFEYDPTIDSYAKKLDFNATINGNRPNGSLIQANNGKYYGMTSIGGTNDYGVLFEYDPLAGTYTKKLDFDGTTNGSLPDGSLFKASNGKLYGMTFQGGLNDLGVLFEYDPLSSTYTKKLNFAGASNGSYPEGALIQGTNGKLYGMTRGGGTNDMGVIFEYDPATGSYTKKFNFTGATNGSGPYGSLLQATNEKLYGMTYDGGTNGLGVLFEYDPATNTFVKKVEFSGVPNGGNPLGSLTQALNGKLYGMNSTGGNNNTGVLFEYDPSTSICTKKLDFYGTTNGKRPYGSLMPGSNGKLYGMTWQGGTDEMGVLFEYDPATDTYTKKQDFNSVNGNYPVYTQLIESCTQPNIATSIPNVSLCEGGNISLVASATGNGLSYQWQVNNGSGFTDISDNSIYANSTTNTLNFTNTSAVMNGYLFRCRLTSACPAISIFSNTITLTVNVLPVTPVITQNLNILHSDAVNGNKWYDQTGLISGALNQDYTIISNGNYHVIVNTAGCSSLPSNSINVVLTRAELTENIRSIRVYPNPVSNELTIDFDGNTDKTGFEIINSTGQKVFSGSLTEKTIVQTTDFSRGVYFIKIENGKTSKYIKFIKQ